MKTKLYLSTLLMLALNIAVAQKGRLNISIANTGSSELSLMSHNQLPGKTWVAVPLSTGKTAEYTLNLTEPQFVTLYCDSSSITGSKELSFMFFLSPGDDLLFKADFAKSDFGLSITGKGSTNNQPLAKKMLGIDAYKFNGDTLPYRVIAAIKNEQVLERKAFDEYIEHYKPNASFIKAYRYNIEYMPVATFYAFKENNKFQIEKQYERNSSKWQQITDSLFLGIKLNNAEALSSSKYRQLVKDFLLREKERLWNLSSTNPETFYREWYNAGVEDGKLMFNDDKFNLLKEKIINKYFTGAVAEYLYGVLLGEAYQEKNPQNIVQIFNRFKQKYPGSIYIDMISPTVNEVLKRLQNPLIDSMIFVKDNGADLKTLNDVLALVRGKTVLVDMWGTWCAPCHEEIEKNGEAIRDHFKGKKLQYLYIANRDEKNQKTWKDLIAYFNMKGIHILASTALSNDIMAKVKGSGYPTYFIINKDGSYALSDAGYPMNREVLLKQLELALAK
jgi:thiol-disulfide isomerase/thioredoxin